jgi:leucyl/phenylalanyl-tRNA--protein transferase
VILKSGTYNHNDMTGDYNQFPNGRVAALDLETNFPPLSQALLEPNGLLAIGGDLSINRLIKAYQEGIFPWFSEGEPVLWWSPDPRMVLVPNQLKISKSLSKRINKKDYEIRFNTNFKKVMECCASTKRTGQEGTCITKSIIDAYCGLHESGLAMSAETWIDGQLVGGLYGVKLGHMFYGESMFHHVTDASKIAFVHMVQRLKNIGVQLIDCQMKTSHLSSFGAKEISRDEFISQVKKLINA